MTGTGKPPAQKTRRAARRALARTRDGIGRVPGPSTNPATNLLIADIAMRAATRLFRRSVERGLLRAKFPPETAHDIVEGRTYGRSLVSDAMARVATRSVPGALLVAGGLVAKSILDRSLSRRKSRRRGERALEEQAGEAGNAEA